MPGSWVQSDSDSELPLEARVGVVVSFLCGFIRRVSDGGDPVNPGLQVSLGKKWGPLSPDI